MIGTFASMDQVAFYVTPYEIITRLSMLPGAVSMALLPAFSSVHQDSSQQYERFFTAGLRYVILLLFPAALLIVLFAREGLALWIGEDFAEHSATVARILGTAILIN